MKTAHNMLVYANTELALYKRMNLRCQIQQVTRRLTRWKEPFVELVLTVGEQMIRSVVWKKSLIDQHRIEVGKEYDFQLEFRRFNGEIRGNVTAIAEADTLILPEEVLSRLPRVEQVDELNEWLRACPSLTLRQFVLDVFSNTETAEAFFTCPASREHHHCRRGGLAEHSLEIARGVLRALPDDEDPQIVWLTSCAELVHDIGKTRTHQANGNYTPLGHVLDHDLLTLELLAPALAKLDQRWPEGGRILRYLLTLKLRPDHAKRPRIPAGIIFLALDRYSAAMDACRQAFEGQPDWRSFAQLQATGPDNRFLRLTGHQV